MKTRAVKSVGDSVFKCGDKFLNSIFELDDALGKVLGMETDRTFMIDSSEFEAIRHEFCNSVSFDCYGTYNPITHENTSMEDVLNVLRTTGDIKFKYNDVHSNRNTIFGYVKDENGSSLAILFIYGDTGDRPFYECGIMRGHITAYGEKKYVKSLHKTIKEKIGETKIPTAKWHYISDGSHSFSEITVSSDVTLKDEYYPFLRDHHNQPMGVEAFLDEYLTSNESILILLGPPGTGKSTLLRHLIVSRNLTVTLTYEEKLLQQDKLFVQHLSKGGDSDLLILEDADVLLESREKAGNHVMNKLLNVSDGIIKVVNKKIIFTTNLPSVRSIDPALLRPGRCHKVVEFRELTFEEACKAANAAGITSPTDEKKTYTIAELFQHKFVGGNSKFLSTRRVGFR